MMTDKVAVSLSTALSDLVMLAEAGNASRDQLVEAIRALAVREFIFNVAAPQVSVAAPQVTVAAAKAPDVRVEPQINVAPAQVQVIERTRKSRITVQRDDRGFITSLDIEPLTE